MSQKKRARVELEHDVDASQVRQRRGSHDSITVFVEVDGGTTHKLTPKKSDTIARVKSMAESESKTPEEIRARLCLMHGRTKLEPHKTLVDYRISNEAHLKLTQQDLESLHCPICWEIFDKPVVMKSCCHNFCHKCITKSLSVKKSCPLCRGESTEFRHSATLQKKLEDFLITCNWPGCHKLMSAAERRAHIETCQFVVVKCPHSSLSCKFENVRSELSTHLKSECAYENILGVVVKLKVAEQTNKALNDKVSDLSALCQNLRSALLTLAAQQNLESRILRREVTSLERQLSCNPDAEPSGTLHIFFQWEDEFTSRVDYPEDPALSSSVRPALDWYCRSKNLSSLVFFCDSALHGTPIKATDTFYRLGLRNLDVIYVSTPKPSTSPSAIYHLVDSAPTSTSAVSVLLSSPLHDAQSPTSAPATPTASESHSQLQTAVTSLTSLITATTSTAHTATLAPLPLDSFFDAEVDAAEPSSLSFNPPESG